MNHFHEAARDGHLDLLRDATRRDANKPDDFGRTPTLWAAYEGNTDALRLLVSRGGDPDLCDTQGHAALHYAALSNHLDTLTFLVSFGCNIWSLTNDYRTAKDLAAENNHHQCLAFLDDVTAQQSAKNQKQVKKMREKALDEADKRVKKVNKKHAEHAKWVKKEEKKAAKESGHYVKKKKGIISTTSNNSSPAMSRPSKSNTGTFSSTSDARSTSSEPSEGQDPEARPDVRESSFWLPTSDRPVAESLQSLPANKIDPSDSTADDDLLTDAVTIEHVKNGDRDPTVSRAVDDPRRPSSSALQAAAVELPWDEELLDSDEDEEHSQTSDLEFFLAVLNLSEYLPMFTREEIDLQALVLLTDEDFVKLGLPLGPRRKLTDAIIRRRNAIGAPGIMGDSQL
ncbi:pre-mRNA splicing regulator USH1G-like [Asterias amurensis]|uniref:pre-mRNA splicing regulator USH1G-like n=1 Tax=Asterias amurensis TaxID=7602 RepID=UPI003AB4A65E